MMSLLILISLAGQTPKAQGVEKAIPGDLKIVAQYGAGHSDWRSWKSTITADGQASQEIFDWPESTRKAFKLSPGDLVDLLDQIDKAEFSKLKERYEANITDHPTLILEITADKKTHRVSIYAREAVKERDDVERFLKVWREFLKKVPSPNPEQKSELYES